MSVASQPSRPANKAALLDAEFDLPALGAALWRHKGAIFLPALLVGLVTLAVVQLIAPKYQSEARVLIEERGNVFLRPEADKGFIDRDTVDEQAVTSQVQLVLSRDLAQEVIEKLKLNTRPEFDPMLKGLSPLTKLLGAAGLIKDPARMTVQERVLSAYYDRLKVYAVEKSRVIVIDFLSEDPALAARVANAIADAYLVRQRAAKREQAQAAVHWLASQVDAMQKRVADAEAKVAAFRGKSNLLIGPNNTTLSEQQLGEIAAQLAAARAQKADVEARARLIREMLRTGQPIESSEILNSELIRRLAEQRVTLRAQLAEQSATLLGGHPRIKELKAQIADLDIQIRAEAETIARALENDAKIASARVDSFAASLDQIKGQAAGSNEQNVHLRALERDAKAQRDLLESYLARYREAGARETSNSEPADARVFSRATVSNIPAYPKKLPTVAIATLATLVLCAGWVMTRELLSAPVAVPAAVRPRAPARLAAAEQAPPWRSPAVVGEATPGGCVPLSAIEDVADRLRHAGAAGRRVAVFSAAPGDDDGTAAIKFARALAGAGARVVLVGLGSGDGAIKAIATEPAADGLFELAHGTASFADIITKDRFSKINLIASGGVGADPVEILAAPGMTAYFIALARSYDHVVIDAGAVGGHDMEAIAEIAPRAIVIAATEATAAGAREQLRAAGFAEVTVLAGDGAASSAAAA